MTAEGGYVGRFAPSPTGPLHFGSLLTAVASYLDARHHQGRWLVRIEDLDPPRQDPTATQSILNLLDAMSLHWDGEVLFQSGRLHAYEEAIRCLDEKGLVYLCDCSRRSLRERQPCRCRQRKPADSNPALRVSVANRVEHFTDLIQGSQIQALAREAGDFILRRKDGLIAYQLAVVVDDAFQGITHLVRGVDLLSSTPRQNYLRRMLGLPSVLSAHLPVVVGEAGHKLSKQTAAKPVTPAQPRARLLTILQLLGQETSELQQAANCAELLQAAAANWDLNLVPRRAWLDLPKEAHL